MKFISRFLPLFVLISCLCGLIYLLAQQNARVGANDLPIQLAEDTTTMLSTQGDTIQATSLPRIDISKSLSTFIIIYDANGKVMSSSGEIDGKIPALPSGVFSYSKEHEDDRFTWQPQEGVRIAAVVKYFTGRTTGYVLAGRSLREIEKREEVFLKLVGLGYLVTVASTFFIVLLITPLSRKKK